MFRRSPWLHTCLCGRVFIPARSAREVPGRTASSFCFSITFRYCKRAHAHQISGTKTQLAGRPSTAAFQTAWLTCQLTRRPSMTAVQTNVADMTTLTHTHTYTHIHAHCIYTLSRHDAALMKSTQRGCQTPQLFHHPRQPKLGVQQGGVVRDTNASKICCRTPARVARASSTEAALGVDRASYLVPDSEHEACKL